MASPGEFDAGEAAAINRWRKFVRRETIYTAKGVGDRDVDRPMSGKERERERKMVEEGTNIVFSGRFTSGRCRESSRHQGFISQIKTGFPGESVGTTRGKR